MRTKYNHCHVKKDLSQVISISVIVLSPRSSREAQLGMSRSDSRTSPCPPHPTGYEEHNDIHVKHSVCLVTRWVWQNHSDTVILLKFHCISFAKMTCNSDKLTVHPHVSFCPLCFIVVHRKYTILLGSWGSCT
jgi:hypothetical protein